ncbi:integrin alpha-6-like isoform X1 [Alosa alosa]|uniref:integrin alpha-6-like isoform X1 n=1 Tax=Alosa alosa TaxID=278164 RepID=UPI002015128F|nr:integrin alpha-6-like isoform X1 [Alosa alosa]
MGWCRITVTLPFLLLIWTCISAFNLDTENVIIKSGDQGSLFGFSLAMHRELKPDKRHLLVGAPKAAGLGAQKSSKTGGLYTCDINAPGTSCTRVQFDEKLDKKSENKDDQWLGVVVQSQGPGGQVLTCAHRYEQRYFVNTSQESRDITGRCYVFGPDLTIDTNRNGEGGEWKFCSGRTRGHERFGSCQQGISATFTRGHHYLIFGAPGAYNWKGIVRLEQKNDSLADQFIFNDGPYEVGDENQQNEDLVPVPASSYLGFSLDSGKGITKQNHLTVVAGAPRANHSGAVVFLKIEPNTATMSTEHILEGEGLASSFGYDVAVLDLNADGWLDVVVGAPQFFIKEGDTGGAIYVYINKKGAWNNIKPVRIDGPKDSMFGLAVENIGDVNLDGYTDVAAGAPYDGDGVGKVFIYHGAKDGIMVKPAQVLTGGSRVKLFGYSMAGNMDMDLNAYPDLAIGSLSDSVYVYRARPVINLQKEVKISPKELDLTKNNCGDSICLEVEACFLYTANPSTINPVIVIKYMFQTDMARRKQGLPPRVTFSTRSSTDHDYESTGTLKLLAQNAKQCIQNKLKLKDNIKDKLRGIPIEVSVEIQESSRKRRALPGLTPILDANEPTSVLSEVNFVKEGCGSDNICQSNLEIKYQFCSSEANKNIFKTLPKRGSVQLISLSDQKEIALEVTVTNKGGDDAYEAAVVASFPRTLSYSATRVLNTDKQVVCVANQNGSQAECELGNPFKKDSEVTFYIILSTGGISLNTTEVEIDLKLKTTSQQQGVSEVKARADVAIKMLLSVTGVAKPSQVYYSGVVKGESSMKYESEVGNLIEYEFRIINLGKSLQSYGRSTLTIHWPKVNDNGDIGKHLLYLMSVTSTGLDSNTCDGEVNPLLLKEGSPTRGKREVASEKPAEEGSIALLTDKRKNKTLSCGTGARCTDLKCHLQGMRSSAVIKLRARLWNGTFLEDYSDLNYLNILVTAKLTVDGKASNIDLTDTSATASVTVFPERRMAQHGGLPWWIILVAILLGLLLLGLLIFLLWKCGFFKRSKYNDSVPSYSAVRIKKEERHNEPDTLEKKQWMTSWNENESYS